MANKPKMLLTSNLELDMGILRLSVVGLMSGLANQVLAIEIGADADGSDL